MKKNISTKVVAWKEKVSEWTKKNELWVKFGAGCFAFLVVIAGAVVLKNWNKIHPVVEEETTIGYLKGRVFNDDIHPETESSVNEEANSNTETNDESNQSSNTQSTSNNNSSSDKKNTTSNNSNKNSKSNSTNNKTNKKSDAYYCYNGNIYYKDYSAYCAVDGKTYTPANTIDPDPLGDEYFGTDAVTSLSEEYGFACPDAGWVGVLDIDGVLNDVTRYATQKLGLKVDASAKEVKYMVPKGYALKGEKKRANICFPTKNYLLEYNTHIKWEIREIVMEENEECAEFIATHPGTLCPTGVKNFYIEYTEEFLGGQHCYYVWVYLGYDVNEINIRNAQYDD